MREPELRRIVGQLGVVLGQRTQRGWLHARCPLAPWTHPRGHDRRPSFGVKVEREGLSAYSCFTCGHKGRISSLCRVLGNYRHGDPHHYEALARDADAADGGAVLESDYEREDCGPPDPEPMDEDFFHSMFPSAQQVPEAKAYLRSRHVSVWTIESLGLLADPEDCRVLFPVRDRAGLLYGYSGRTWADRDPKVRDYCYPKRHFVLGEERWRPGDPEAHSDWWARTRPLVLVEGLFAYAHMVELRVERICNVGALLGSTMTREKADRILELGAPVYLFLDDDVGGDSGIYGRLQRDGSRQDGAVDLLRDLPLAVPRWPEGKTDPDELSKAEIWNMLRDTPVLTSEEGGFSMSEPWPT